ncbi:cytochrome P450 family protein [Ceratobasidium sp. AG-Ba]|nr:cytochrome P450 family protein [Ceratobasidium sp. AG-Ba]
MLQYGSTLKWYRALLHQQFNPRASKGYLPVHYHETRKFMKRLLENPKDFLSAVRLMTSSVFLRVAYGHEVKSVDDIFVRNAALGTAAFSETMQPTRWVVDMLPMLRYLPVWFPLATFHRRAKQIYEMESTHRELPFQDLEKRVSEGTAEACFASKLLHKDDGALVDPEEREHIKYLTSSVYSGAADSATSLLESFFLAMTLYPDVQAKAREEIDAYTEQYTKGSRSQLILFEDRANLPYTRMKMNLNMWKMMHDPEVYEQPDRFMPERYLVENPPPEPESYAFAFGRRICPGVATSKHMLFIAMSNVLANFTIGKAKDERGLDITPEERYSSDLTR